MRANQNLLLILLALLVFISGCSGSAKLSPIQADADSGNKIHRKSQKILFF